MVWRCSRDGGIRSDECFYAMNKWEFQRRQLDLFDGEFNPHGEKIKRGLSHARAAGKVLGRPRKDATKGDGGTQKKTEARAGEVA